MNAHIIYTVPLRLAREFGPELGIRYDQDPFVLPMINILGNAGYRSDSPGARCMQDILNRRIEDSLDKVFDHDALAFVLEHSGGSPRHLMTFVQNACSYLDSLPITLDAVQKAVGQSVRAFAVSIAEPHWLKLAKLDLSDGRSIENRDLDYMELLEKQCILEYVDVGNTEGFDFASHEPWYAVHPIVRKLSKFIQAREDQQSQDEEEKGLNHG